MVIIVAVDASIRFCFHVSLKVKTHHLAGFLVVMIVPFSCLSALLIFCSGAPFAAAEIFVPFVVAVVVAAVIVAAVGFVGVVVVVVTVAIIIFVCCCSHLYCPYKNGL